MSREPANARLIAQSRGISTLAAFAVIIIGGLVMLGWLFDIPQLKSVIPGQVTMKFNTALCFVLSGIALLILDRQPRPALILSAIVAAVGFITLAQYLSGWDAGIDQWLIHEPFDAAQTQAPGRMSFVSAINFCLIGSSLILMSRSRQIELAQVLALAAGLSGLLSLVGHLYGVHSLYQLVALSRIAFHTAAAFIILCLGIFFARPARGLASILVADYAGGLLARRLLPIAVFVPLVLGWLLLEGQKVGLYDAHFLLALFAMSNIVVFTMLTFWAARSLNITDSQRSDAMQALRQARDELEARVRARTLELANANEALAASERTLRFHASLQAAVTDAVIATDLNFNIQSWNAAAARIYGWRAEEVIGKPITEILKTIFSSGQSRGQVLHDFAEHGFWTGEVIQHRKDGSPIHILGSTVSFSDEHGDPIGIVAVNHDITNRKRAEEALRLSEERYRNLSGVLWDYACSYRYITEDEARLEWVVGAFEEITGHSIEEALANFSLSLPVHPDDQELFHLRHQKLRAGQDDVSEFRIINARGEARWVRSYGRPEWDAARERVIRVYIGVQDIGERKRVEQELQQQRDFAQQMMNALGQGVTVVDAEGRFEYVNPAYARILGLPQEDIIGKTPLDVTIPEDRPALLEARSRRQAGETSTYETRFRQPDGRTIHALITGVPRWQNEQIVGSIAVITDLTERNQIEEALRESEERYRFLFNQIADAIFIHDENAQILEVNTAACAILGYSRDELLRMKTTDIDDPGYRQGFSDRLAIQLEQGNLHDIEGVHLTRDGRRISILVNSRRIIYQGRTAVLAVARDITERKQVENLFRALLESAPDAMIIADTEGRISLINSQAEQLFGYSKSELAGQMVEILVPEAFRAGHIQHRSGYVHQAAMRGMGSGRDLYALHRDGTTFPVEISLSPIETDGRTLIASAIRDITPRKQFEQELDDARKRAEEANRLKSEFLATMSHELRTPLNSVIGFSDALLNNLTGAITPRQQEYLGIILNNGEHLLALINNILDISKIEAGQFELRHASINLSALLDQTRQSFQNLCDQKGLRLVTFLDPAMPTVVMGDDLRLRQILINLVGNAIKFTDAGQVEICMIKRDDNGWTITARDSGIGIPAEALDYVFEQFRQVDNSSTRLYEGTGLGLAIVQRLVTLMGGSIRVESEIHKGSTFTITLPLITE